MRRLIRLRFYARSAVAIVVAVSHVVPGTWEAVVLIVGILWLVAGGVDLAGGLRGAGGSVPPSAVNGSATGYVSPAHHHHGVNVTPPTGGHGGGHH